MNDCPEYPIAPWHGSCFGELFVPSPDRQHIAHLTELIEIGMGGPKSGSLSINDELIQGVFSPSCIWSLDSKYLAIPVWTHEPPVKWRQRLGIFCVARKILKVSRSAYGVLQLESFENDCIRGIESPTVKTKPFMFNVPDIGFTL